VKGGLRLVALAGALSWIAGCGFAGRALSSPREYEAYRSTRAGYTVEDRLRAAKLYLGQFPQGRFAEEVQRLFDEEERRFFQAQRGTVAGLDWYLKILPDGPHANDAQLLTLELERQAAAQREDALVQRGRTIERRLAAAELQRRRAVEEPVNWVTALASSQRWGRATWEQPAELLRALRTEPAPGRCEEVRCLRTRSVIFQVPVRGGGLEERALTYDLLLELHRGGVVRGALRGPALFSRLYEAARGKPLPPDPLEARAEAVSHALELVGGAFEAVAPAASCDRGIRPPQILLRQCNGWRVAVIAGDGAAEDDLIEVEGPPTVAP
jgi:hypothetical protein